MHLATCWNRPSTCLQMKVFYWSRPDLRGIVSRWKLSEESQTSVTTIWRALEKSKTCSSFSSEISALNDAAPAASFARTFWWSWRWWAFFFRTRWKPHSKRVTRSGIKCFREMLKGRFIVKRVREGRPWPASSHSQTTESRTALDELTQLLDLGSVYPFQQV